MELIKEKQQEIALASGKVTSEASREVWRLQIVWEYLRNKLLLDDEAPKKALTDAMTIGFSHLGVSADVFLGMFDNSKYVSAMKEKFNGTTAAEGIKVKVVNLRKDIKKELNNNRKDKNDK